MGGSTCDVLRCTGERRHVLAVNAPGYPLMEVAICDAHQSAFDTGTPWYYNCGDSLLYAGDDLRALGLNRVTGIEAYEQGDRLSREDVHARLRIEYENIAGGDPGVIDLLLTDELRDDLRLLVQ